MSKIVLENITKIFGERQAEAEALLAKGSSKKEILAQTGCTVGLTGINLSIPKGEFFVIIGLSGSGKSTLVRHINRLIEPTSGRILVDGEDILQKDEKSLRHFRRHHISMVFQHFGLLPHKNILDNIGYGLKIRGVDKDTVKSESRKWLKRVGLEGLEASKPHQLSGGMRQRVGIARAFATDPKILLMDEPFGALDPLIRGDMQKELIKLQRDLKKTAIFITHDLDEALKLGDRIAILKDGELVQVGSKEDILLRPADGYVRSFTKDINRGKFLTAKSVMAKAPSDLDGVNGSSKVDMDAPLMDIVKVLMENGGKDIFVTRQNRVRGLINKKDLMANISL